MGLSSVVLWLLLLQCLDIVYSDVIFRPFNQNEGSVCYLSDKTRGVCRKSCSEQSSSEYISNVCNVGQTPTLYCCVDKVTAQQYPTIHEACLKRRLAEEFDRRASHEQKKVFDKDDETRTRVIETVEKFERECYESSLSLEEDERNNYLGQCLNIRRPSMPNRYYRPDMLSEYHKVAGIGFKSSNNVIVWTCSGNFIHASYVLAAASCIKSPRNTPNIVRHSYNHLFDTNMKFSDFDIRETFIHPNYNEQSSRNDIAILRTNRGENRSNKLEIHLSEPIQACLWTQQDLPSQGLIAYDLTDEFRSSFPTMTQPEECSKKISGVLQEGFTSCLNCGFQNQSDIVASFQYLEGHDLNVPYIVGIGSSKLPCSLNSPALVTHIYPHLEWIDSVISK